MFENSAAQLHDHGALLGIRRAEQGDVRAAGRFLRNRRLADGKGGALRSPRATRLAPLWPLLMSGGLANRAPDKLGGRKRVKGRPALEHSSRTHVHSHNAARI